MNRPNMPLVSLKQEYSEISMMSRYYKQYEFVESEDEWVDSTSSNSKTRTTANLSSTTSSKNKVNPFRQRHMDHRNRVHPRQP